jgi:hypothetical protein
MTMMQLRAANERGHAEHGWLSTYHSFSFADYYDPLHMGISNLRVINDDRIVPGGGFPTHGHRDMEIVTYVLSGALEHKDSMGNGSVIRPGDVQRMSAGTGVRHSEFNASDSEPVHLLQIWLLPNRQGVEPGYAQRHFPAARRRAVLRLLVSPDGREDSLSARQDALLYGSLLEPGESVDYSLAEHRTAYVQLAKGSAKVNGSILHGGDGLRIEQETQLRLEGLDSAELLLFDLP